MRMNRSEEDRNYFQRLLGGVALSRRSFNVKGRALEHKIRTLHKLREEYATREIESKSKRGPPTCHRHASEQKAYSPPPAGSVRPLEHRDGANESTTRFRIPVAPTTACYASQTLEPRTTACQNDHLAWHPKWAKDCCSWDRSERIPELLYTERYRPHSAGNWRD